MDPFEETFSQPELAVVIKCNVHPWMRAFAFIFNHPYYDVTAKTGTFELKNLPPGTYTIEAWQEKYGAQDQTVTIGPKESKAISFTYKAAEFSGRTRFEADQTVISCRFFGSPLSSHRPELGFDDKSLHFQRLSFIK